MSVRGYAPYILDGAPKFRQNKLYLGNKMTGIPFFNAPWFDAAAAELRTLPAVSEVFNPAEHDRELGLDPMKCPKGDPQEAINLGLPAGVALRDDLLWIGECSDGLIVGPDWQTSPGAVTEVAYHQALRLPVWTYLDFVLHWDEDVLYELRLPPIMEMRSGGLMPGEQVVKASDARRARSPWHPWERH